MGYAISVEFYIDLNNAKSDVQNRLELSDIKAILKEIIKIDNIEKGYY